VIDAGVGAQASEGRDAFAVGVACALTERDRRRTSQVQHFALGLIVEIGPARTAPQHQFAGLDLLVPLGMNFVTAPIQV